MRKVRLRDVAEAAGVSQGTASNVYNRPEIVRPEVRAQVLAAAERLGFAGPAPAASALRRGRANLIAVVSDESPAYFLGDPYGRRLLQGVAEVCDAQGVGLTLASTRPRDGGQGWSIDTALVDGFILFCYEDDTEVATRARARSLPIVAIDAGRIDGAASVGIDDRAAAHAAAAHVTALGHRRIGILSLELVDDGRTGPIEDARLAAARYRSSRDRLLGCRDALAEAGADPKDCPAYETFNDGETAAAGLDWLFERPAPPTAIVAMSDVLALAALDWLSARGLRVPQDVSVTGFDDTPEAARAAVPLTTLSQPADLKGRIAAEMLLGLRPMGDHALAVGLTVRASTTPPPRRDAMARGPQGAIPLDAAPDGGPRNEEGHDLTSGRAGDPRA
jgi:DNA-binding LacI/PurR family transcriptional regulator